MTTKGKTIQIKIARVPWKVKFLPSWHEINPDGTDRIYGITIFNDHEIRIAGDAPAEKQHITLFHEVLHAIVEDYGITPLQKENGDHDEKHIDLLAIALCEVLESLGMTPPHITINGGK